MKNIVDMTTIHKKKTINESDKENEKKRLCCGNYSRDKQLLQNAIVCSMTTDSKSKHSVRFKSEMCGISKSAFSRKEKNLKKEQKKWATANSKDEKMRLIPTHKNYQTYQRQIKHLVEEWILQHVCVRDSPICNEYLDSVYSDCSPALFPKDPYAKARVLMVMESFGKV